MTLGSFKVIALFRCFSLNMVARIVEFEVATDDGTLAFSVETF